MCAILRRCSLLTKKAALAALAPIDSGFSGPVAPLRCRREKHTRNRGALSKSKAPKAFADGAEMSLRSIAISVPQRPAH